MIAIFHEIRSLHNVGSMFRTADAAGLSKIYLTGITPGPTNRFNRPELRFTKVSLGAEDFVAWEKVPTTGQLLAKLKKEGWRIIAIEQDNHSMPYYQLKLSATELAKAVLVVGNEVSGLPADILAQADEIVEIPMLGQKESLNVSVAFGIVVFNLTWSS